jgi:hypothetical protein
MRPFIGDGHDSTFYIKGEAGLYPACKFSGRLMAHHQAAAVLRDSEADKAKSDTVFSKAIAERLTGWAYEDGGQWKPFDDNDGNKLAVNAANVGGLAFNLFNRLRDVILGIQPADVDPATCIAAKTPSESEKN